MYNSGEDIYSLVQQRRTIEEKKSKSVQSSSIGNLLAKLVISPNNQWNMWKNDLTLLMFIIYSFLLPLYASYYPGPMQLYDINILFIFDFVFVFDRSLDLFVGWFVDTNQLEQNLFNVIAKNLSFIFFIEVAVAMSPQILMRIAPYSMPCLPC